jgi:pyridoxal 5'-phosphate synthase pdxS subunit
VRHLRTVNGDIRRMTVLREDELMHAAKEMGAPFELVKYVHDHGKLPVPNFAAGGVATPADAALCMLLGAETVFVGSGIFKSTDPAVRAKAVVQAVTHYKDPQKLLEVSEWVGEAMRGLDIATMPETEKLAGRGW